MRYLADMESPICGKEKADKIIWTDSLIDSFLKAHLDLKSTSCITTPTLEDQLIITHDGSCDGIGSVMFVKRGADLLIG